MSQFNFIKQEIFEEGPRESVGLGATPVIQYQEGITELPQPISPQLAIDSGINWNALGVDASETAAKLYEQTVDYVISSKQATLANTEIELKSAIQDWEIKAQAKLLPYKYQGAEPPAEVYAQIDAEYDKLKSNYKKEAIRILGESDYALFTDNKNPLMTNIGSKYQPLAIQTRKGLLETEQAFNQSKYQFDLASIAASQSAEVKKKSETAFITKDQLDSLPLDPVAAGAMLFGNTNENNQIFDRTIPVQQPDGTTKQVPVFMKENGQYRLNVPISQLTEDEVNATLPYIMQHSNLQNGTMIHKEMETLVKQLLARNLSPSEEMYTARLVGNLNPSTIAHFASKIGISAEEAARIQLYHSAARSPLFNMATLREFNKYTPEQIKGAINLFNIRYKQQPVTSTSDIYTESGSPQEQAVMFTVNNKVIDMLSGKGKLDDYVVTSASGIIRDTSGEPNKNMAQLIQDNPELKMIMMRAFLFVNQQPHLANLDLKDSKNIDKINTALEESFLKPELSSAGLIWVPEHGKFYVAPSSTTLVGDYTGVAKENNYITSGIPEAAREEVRKELLSKGSNGVANILVTDSNDASGITTREGAHSFIKTLSPNSNPDLANIMLDVVHESQRFNFDGTFGNDKDNLKKTNQRVKRNIPTDAVLLQMAYAINPRTWVALGIMQDGVDPGTLGMEQQVEYAAKAFGSITGAQHWGLRLDYGDPDTMAKAGGGITIGITNIPYIDKNGKTQNLLNNLYSKNQLVGGVYIPRRGTSQTPVLMGRDMVQSEIQNRLKKLIEIEYSGKQTGRIENPDLTIRGSSGFPSSNANYSPFKDPRFWRDTDWLGSTEDRRGGFETYFAGNEYVAPIPNKEINNLQDFITYYKELHNKGVIKEMIAKDHAVFNEDPTRSALFRLNADYGDVDQDSVVFSRDVLNKAMAVGKELGYTKFTDYLSIMFTLTEAFESNQEFVHGYPMGQTEGFTDFGNKANYPIFTGYPSILNGGVNKGLAPYGLEPTAAKELADQGYSFYTEKGSGNLYAFKEDESIDENRFDLLWYNEQLDSRGVSMMRGVDLAPQYAFGDLPPDYQQENANRLNAVIEEHGKQKKYQGIILQYLGKDPDKFDLNSYRRNETGWMTLASKEKFREILTVPEKLADAIRDITEQLTSEDAKKRFAEISTVPEKLSKDIAANDTVRYVKQFFGFEDVDLGLDKEFVLPKLSEETKAMFLKLKNMDLTTDEKKILNKIIDSELKRLGFLSDTPNTNTPVSPGTVSDKPHMKLISEYEGLKTTAYWDNTGRVWTIGKGTTKYPNGSKVKQGDTITEEQATQFAQAYIDTKIIPTLSKTIPTWTEMSPNQQSAIISFAYNVGENFYNKPGFETISAALSKVSTFGKVPEALSLYNKSGGKKLNGLIKRRKAEAELWSSSK